MSNNDEIVSEIWVSGTYSSVFFTRQEVEKFLDSLLEKDGSPPKGLNVMFVPRKLIKPYSKQEILNASPSQLKIMLGITDNLS